MQTERQAEIMAESDSDSSWNDIIKDWTLVNRFGEVEVSFCSFHPVDVVRVRVTLCAVS